MSGALLHAVQLVRRGWMDSAIWERLEERYPLATGDQIWRMIGLAHAGVLAAAKIPWHNPTHRVNLNLAPQLPQE